MRLLLPSHVTEIPGRFFRLHYRLLFLAALLLCLFSGTAIGAGGDTVWQRADVQTGKQQATASVVDHEGNVIVTGYQNLSDSNDDYLTVKFKADGSGIAWRAPFDKAGGSDQATAVTIDSNNDVIVTGVIWNGINQDIQTIKYSGATGSVVWQQPFDSANHGNDVGTAIGVDSLNNIYVGGYVQNSAGNDDYIVLKYSPDGTLAWQAIWNSPANDIDKVFDLAVGSDSVAVTGQSKSGTIFTMATVKFNLGGEKLWDKIYTATGNAQGKKVRIDTAGNVIVTGVANNYDMDIYTVKYNSADGGIAWEKTFNGAYDDEPYGLGLDAGGDVYITGYTWTDTGNNDFYTARYSAANGSLVWEKLFDSGNGNTDVAIATGLSIGEAGDLFITGYTSTAGNYDFQTIKYRRDNGNQLWHQTYNGTGNKNDRPVAIGISPAGEPLVSGWSDNGTDLDYIVIKYDPGAINPPTSLTATTLSASSIRLDWADNSGNEDGFTIERKKGENGQYSVIFSPGQNVTTYTDADPLLEANTYYYYRIKANSAVNGDSLFSNEAHALTVFVTFAPAAWSYSFNSPDNMDDYANAIAVGPDNNPVVTGYSQRTVGGFDYLTMKFDRSAGTPLWSDLYDDVDSEMDVAKCLSVDNGNNAVVSGFSQLFFAPAQRNINSIFTIKYRADNPVVNPPVKSWSAQYNGPGAIDDRATAIATTTDANNNIVVIGYGKNAANNDDIYVIKYNSDGSRAWAVTPFDGGGDDIPNAVAIGPDGSVFVAGYSEQAPGAHRYNFFTAKYNGTNGSLVWSDIYSVNSGGNNLANALAIDAGGDVYVTGFATNLAGNKDMYTIKYSGSGSSAVRIWERAHNGAASGDDEAVGVRVDPIDGNIVVAGTTLTAIGDRDVTLIRYTAAGTPVTGWPKTLLRPASDDTATALTMDSSGYIYIAGTTASGSTSDAFSLIYNHEGSLLGATLFNGAANSYDEAVAITVNYKGEAFIAGSSINAASNADYLVFKQTNSFLLVPAPFTATVPADYSKVNLSWSDNSPGATFNIERTLGPVTDSSIWSSKATDLPAGTTSYQDNGLNPGTSYCYRIEAVKGGLNSRKIITCATTTLQAPVITPVTVVSATAIDVNWNNVSGNSGYKVERSADNLNWSQAGANLPADTTLMHDTGLTAGTVYYYRVSSLNSSGASLPSQVQAAPVLNVQSISPTNISLSWPPVSGATGYSLERSPNNSDWSQIAAISTPYYNNSSLTPATTYYYRLLAVTSSGTSAPSLTVMATTTLAAPTLSVPTATSSQVNLSWSDVTGATGFVVWEKSCNYNGNNNYDIPYCKSDWYSSSWWSGWYQVATTEQGLTTYARTGLPSGYAYQYRITATAGSISSPASSERHIWTLPAAPTLGAPSAPSDTTVNLSWNDVTGDNGYTLERKTGAGGTYAPVATPGLNVPSYTDSTVVGETTYFYRIRANGFSSTPEFSNEQSITTPPAGPTVATVTAGTTTTATWNDIPGATSYEVRRSEFTNYDRPDLAGNPSYASYWSAWTTAGTVTAATYVDTNVTAGHTYKYSVRALVSGNYTGWGSDNGKFVTTTPPTPGNLAATGATASQINLTWSNTYGETNFALQYKERSGADCSAGTWTEITAIRQNDPVLSPYYYAIGSLAPSSAIYCLQVRAYNSSGTSDWSPAVTYLPPALLNAPTSITQSGMTLSWNNVAGNSGYTLERSTDNFGGDVITPISRSTNVTSYTDSSLAANTVYYYRVKTRSGTAVSLVSNTVSGTTQSVSAPVLNSLTGMTTSQITLNWTGVTGNTGYKIERSPDNASWEQIATPVTNAVTYTNTDLNSGTRYYYRVSSRNSQGSYSAPSNVLAAVTLIPAPSLSLEAVSEAQVKLAWQVVYGATSYKVLRSVGPSGPFSEIATPSVAYATLYCGSYTLPTIACPNLSPISTTYTDNGLSMNTQYCYQLKGASAIAEDSAPSAVVCQRTPAIGGPVITAVTPLNSLKIQLEWSYDPTDCQPVACDNPDGFEIWKQLWNGEWAQLATVGNIAAYTDTIGLEPAKTFNYRVRAFKGSDKSPFSNISGAATPAFSNGDNTCNFKITYTSSGPGSITVTPAGVSCGTGCYAYCSGSQVTLRGVADTGAGFNGWTGDCSGSTACSLTIDSDKNVSGNFN